MFGDPVSGRPGDEQQAADALRLRHPDDERLNAHVAGALLRDTRRGPRIDKRPGHNIGGSMAVTMAWDRHEHKPAEVKLLGWI